MTTFLKDDYLTSLTDAPRRHYYSEPDRRRAEPLSRFLTPRVWGGFVLCLAFAVLWYIDPGQTYVPPPAPPPSPAKAVPGTEEFTINAFLAAKRFVSAGLLTPSKASFPMSTITVYRHAKQADVYIVTGQVDSQNAFAAMLRQHYEVDMRFLCSANPERAYSRDCWEPQRLQIGQQIYAYGIKR